MKESSKVTIKKLRRKKKASLPFLEQKEQYFWHYGELKKRKRWYKRNHHDLWLRMRMRRMIQFLADLPIPFKILSVVRWVLVDFLRCKPGKFWGIYCYVALPGEGKTLSMVAHMERCRKDVGADRLYIATNFHYRHQDMQIDQWPDMIRAAKFAMDHGQYCIIAFDEIHVTFDSSDWKSFPPEMLSLLSFNRKYGLQFICSSQIYDRIPSKVRAISNYTVLCKNSLGLDRHFKNYYFNTLDYEAKFSGKRTHANFIRTYVADDYLYSLYDTKAQVDNMIAKADEQKKLKEQAFDLLFGAEGAAAD